MTAATAQKWILDDFLSGEIFKAACHAFIAKKYKAKVYWKIEIFEFYEND